MFGRLREDPVLPMRGFFVEVVLALVSLAICLLAWIAKSSTPAEAMVHLWQWLLFAGIWLTPRLGLLFGCCALLLGLVARRGAISGIALGSIIGTLIGVIGVVVLFLGMGEHKLLQDIPLAIVLSFLVYGGLLPLWRKKHKVDSRRAWLLGIALCLSFILFLRTPPGVLYFRLFADKNIDLTWILYASPSLEVERAIRAEKPLAMCVEELFLRCPGWVDERPPEVQPYVIPGTDFTLSGLDQWLRYRAIVFSEQYNRRLQSRLSD